MMGEQAIETTPPAPTAPKRRRFWLNSVFSIMGLLLVGAGLCSSVFCGFTFNDVKQARDEADSALSQARRLEGQPAGSAIAYQGQPLPLSGWQEMANRLQQASQPKLVQAYQLLSLSIGLILGGTSFWLLGWGLRVGNP
ncbi:MAG TPA: hypothetical protein VG013_29180 [Gemmataceae bacterium]|jgi:hypothetical protein|nr:hypothetical protein [Gemmataceae bacterium]